MDLLELSNSWVMPLLVILTVVLALWDGVWKIIAMWRAARNKELGWFICIAIFNTMGILPIIYVLTHKKEEEK
jgi:fumarate reductase subunit D